MRPTGEQGQDQEVLTRTESRIELERLPLHGQKDKAARISPPKKPHHHQQKNPPKKRYLNNIRIKLKMRDTSQFCWCFFYILLN